MSRVFDLMDALPTTWRALSGYCAPGGTGIPVFDGPNESDIAPPVFVVVGARSFAADEDNDSQAATSDTEWVSMPSTVGSQREDVTVNCAVTAWTGNAPGGYPDWSTLRTTVAATVSDLRDSLRPLTALGLSTIHYLAMTDGRVIQEFTPDGAFVTFEFTVSARFNN